MHVSHLMSLYLMQIQSFQTINSAYLNGETCGSGRLLLPPNSHFFLFESHQGSPNCCDFRGRRPPTQDRFLTHFICLALGLLTMKQMERHCMIHAWSDSSARPISSGSFRFLPVFPRLHARKHPGGVASMTRDKGYPDWLVLSARLLAQPCRPG